MPTMRDFRNVAYSEAFALKSKVSEGKGQTISSGILYKDDIEIYLYFLDADEEISEMKAPYDNLMIVLEGELRIGLEPPVLLSEGDAFILPPDTQVSLHADKPNKHISILLPMEEELIKNVEKSKKMKAKDMVDYRPGQIANLTLVKRSSLNMSVIAIDEGEALNTHSAPGDAMALGLEGEGEIVIGGVPYLLKEGETIIMPKDIPHSVKGVTRFKMLLILVK